MKAQPNQGARGYPRPVVYVEHERKAKTFWVYLGGDADHEGQYDQSFSYGPADEIGPAVSEDEARGAALDYASGLDKKFQGGIAERRDPRRPLTDEQKAEARRSHQAIMRGLFER